jgi:hypothetical protein
MAGHGSTVVGPPLPPSVKDLQTHFNVLHNHRHHHHYKSRAFKYPIWASEIKFLTYISEDTSLSVGSLTPANGYIKTGMPSIHNTWNVKSLYTLLTTVATELAG